MSYRETKWKNFRTKNKYNNKSCAYNGSIYDSKIESKVAQDLDLRIRANDIKSWEKQVKLSLDVNGFHICNYYIDFIITHNDGSREYLEVKSHITKTPTWRIKWKLFEALFEDFRDTPDDKMTVVTL